jgi:hypothetical protein
MTKKSELTLGADMLDGAVEVSDYLDGKLNPRQVYAYSKQLGLVRLGGKLIGFKSKLRERLLNGELAS